MNHQHTFIRAMIDVIDKVGTYTDLGCPINKITMYKEKAFSLAPNKNVCILSGWIWIDIEQVQNSVLRGVIDPFKPSFLVADYVLEDSSGRFSEGSYASF